VSWRQPYRIANAGVTAEHGNPDLSRVDEIGFVDLMPGGGHGFAF
jgi:hypothetical protein